MAEKQENVPSNVFGGNDVAEQLKLTGKRISEARKALGISIREMAILHNISEQEYLQHENGEADTSFSFLLKTAERFGMDLNALITGESPRLSFYTLTRKISGQRVERSPDFEYFHQAAQMKNRMAEPFVVRAPYMGENAPVHLSTHAGQEFDYVLSGKLKVQLEDKVEILEAGDSVYYDSRHPHGMVAVGGEECTFLAVVMKSTDSKLPEKVHREIVETPSDQGDLIYHRFMEETIDEDGLLKAVKFNIPENFNFAYDVLDELAVKHPAGRAMRYVSADRSVVRDFTYREISELSQQAANYFTSLGIKKGDRVLLILKRHYQYWYVVNALHRIGAVAIPAPNQLLAKDVEYRLQSADVRMVVTTSEKAVVDAVNEACKNAPTVEFKLSVNGEVSGWHNFDVELERFSKVFPRPADLKVSDPMLMFFSSGTSGYPKMVLHDHAYPLGHILTARWWLNVQPGELHFTISDTGWGKSSWGKHYGQWLCEAQVFVFDFDRFHADEILPMFKQHNISTFCAPPTMYRFFIKEDLSKYDFSTLKYAATAGEALNPEVFHQFYSVTGLKIMEAFGQTETTMSLGNLVGTVPQPGSMGRPSPQYPVVLLDADGNPVAAGETGEICIKAEKGEIPGLFCGYNNDPERTAEAWHDGYYHTGDVAWCDESGCFWYVGRSDDVIKTSGYRIGPFEVESVIMELPYVLECAVTGAPDPVRGQVIKAWIMLTKDTVPSDELKKEIQDYVKAHTAPYKYPRLIEFVDSLPKTSSGKIRRTELRNR
ncbi:MAG: cupin domain-containing protein [Lentisphaerae bacterium]|nr:cupin domain-containing protein [Lentisphaerota bacterium]